MIAPTEASCRDCPPDQDDLYREMTRYLDAEREATRTLREASGDVRGSSPATGGRAAGSHLLPLTPSGHRDGSPGRWGGDQSDDLPPVVRAATVRRHLELVGAAAVDDPREAIVRVQDSGVPVTAGAVAVVFPSRSATDLTLLRLLMGTEDLPADWALATHHVQPIVGYCGAALGLLSRRAPDLAAAVGGLVAALVVAARRGTGAASSSAAIGAIHLCPRSKWPVTKYAELFVHEYVHQALFLDECVHGMFAGSADELDGAAAQVISAVRKVPRGYDKSFHAAYVAYVQRRLYERLGEPDPAPVGPLDRTLGELTERAGWLTDHGRRRLTELVDLDRAHPAG